MRDGYAPSVSRLRFRDPPPGSRGGGGAFGCRRYLLAAVDKSRQPAKTRREGSFHFEQLVGHVVFAIAAELIGELGDAVRQFLEGGRDRRQFCWGFGHMSKAIRVVEICR